MRSLPFLLREAMTNLRRHGFMTLAAITTIAVALALLGRLWSRSMRSIPRHSGRYPTLKSVFSAA
jgi:cell division protein FtsX